VDIVRRAERGNQEIYRNAIGRAGGEILGLGGVIVALGTIPHGSLANMSFRTDPVEPDLVRARPQVRAVWRRGRDSNPRRVAANRISSAAP
jgi:hypothetical protein